MDDVRDIKQPLLSEYDMYNEKDPEALSKQQDELPAPVSSPQQRPARSWTRRVIRVLVLVATFSVLLSYAPNPVSYLTDQSDPMHAFTELLASHHGKDVHSTSCDEVAFQEGAAYSKDARWFTLDRDFFRDGASASVTYDLTLASNDLKVFSKGPIVGNVTLTSGETKKDGVVEVEIEFKKPHCKKGKNHHDDDDKDKNLKSLYYPFDGEEPPFPEMDLPEHFGEDDEEDASLNSEFELTKKRFWTRAWGSPFSGTTDEKDDPSHHPHHGHHGPPPKVKICPLYTDEGHIKGLGIIAYHHDDHEHKYPHPPPPPPPFDGEHQRSHPPHHGPWNGHHGHYGRPALANITIRFPKSDSAKSSHTLVESFKASLPGFKFVVYDLAVAFGRLELVTVGRPVFVKHLSATFLKIVSVRGPIFGRFSVSKGAELISVGKPIAAKVDLYSASDDQLFNATYFSAITSNAWVAANVSLHKSSDEVYHYPASYVVKTYSSGSSTWKDHTHSGTFLKVYTQPTNTTLVVESTARDAPVLVSVPSTYQGGFELTSPFSKPVLSVNEDAEDPEGDDRERKVELFKTWGAFRIRGLVKWVKDEFTGRLGGCSGNVHVEEGVAKDGEGKKHAWGKIKLLSIKKPAKLYLA